MKKIAVYLSASGHKSNRADNLISFGKYLESKSYRVKYISNNLIEPADLAVIHGPVSDLEKNHISPMHKFRQEIARTQLSHKKPFLIFEGQLWGKNIENIKNQYQRCGLFSQTPDLGEFNNKNSPPNRWNMFLARSKNTLIKDWRENGNHILFAMNNTGGSSNRGVDIIQWTCDKIMTIRTFTDRAILLRPYRLTDPEKDKLLNFTKNIKNLSFSSKGLEEDLINAHSMVCYTTTSAVTSILLGIPVFTDHPACWAYPVANKDLSLIETPILYNRDQWLYDLSYAQWHLDEIKLGVFWNHILPKLNTIW